MYIYIHIYIYIHTRGHIQDWDTRRLGTHKHTRAKKETRFPFLIKTGLCWRFFGVFGFHNALKTFRNALKTLQVAQHSPTWPQEAPKMRQVRPT